MNLTAEERLISSVEAVIYVFDCENELHAGAEQFAVHVGTAKMFTNLIEKLRRTLKTHRLPSNVKEHHILITSLDIIQQRDHLQYPYTSKKLMRLLRGLVI